MAPQVGLEPTTTRLTAECSAIELLRIIGFRVLSSKFLVLSLQLSDLRIGEAFRFSNPLLYSGNVLLSRAVSSQVPSALRGLTSVFGMGTGGSLSLLSPEFFQGSRLPALPSQLHTTLLFFLQYEASFTLPRLSPRPISITKLHALLRFHR